MSNNYTVCLVDEAVAALHWPKSPNGTAFTDPRILSAMSGSVEWWLASKGEEPLCLWPAPLNEHGALFRPPFSYWIGPMWLREDYSAPAHRWLSLSTTVYEMFISRFLDRYGRVIASLAPGLTDVRVFDWWNYHEAELPRFSIRPRYTARLDLSKNRDDIHSDFRELRRRELRKAGNRKDIVLTTDASAVEVKTLYDLTMQSQSNVPVKASLAAIESLHAVASDGLGFVSTVRERSTGQALCAVLVILGNQIANMLVNAVRPEWRNTGVLQLATHNALQQATSLDCRAFDFNGANSPRRGDDKHSYGSHPVLYFDISLAP